MAVHQSVGQQRRRNGGFKPTDYVFMPDFNGSPSARDRALQNLSTLFSAVLRMSVTPMAVSKMLNSAG